MSFPNISFGNGLALLIFQHLGCLYIFPEIFFHFLFRPQDEFVLDDLKKIFGEEPAKSSGI